MKLSIIIVSWNVRELLIKCLNSIYHNNKTSDLEVFVVDNDSQDDTAKLVAKQFPQVKLLAQKANLGFAKANNLAIKSAQGDYILLLNPDTETFPDTLAKSLDFMASHPDCGVLGCQMLYADKKLQPSVRRFPKPWPTLLMLLKLPKIFPRLKSVDNYLATDFDYAKEQTVDQVMGAFMLIPKKVIDKIGLLDENFFIWFEEVDFCRRVWSGGYKVYYSPAIKIIHHGGQSFSQQKTVTKQRRFFKSAFIYFKKYGLFSSSSYVGKRANKN
ncbi:MAG: glycosyltransferase family 2 protein [Patescibacteria group bacterium]